MQKRFKFLGDWNFLDKTNNFKIENKEFLHVSINTFVFFSEILKGRTIRRGPIFLFYHQFSIYTLCN